MYLALTGARFKTADMLYAGVATQHVPAAKTPELIAHLADGETPEAAIGDFSAFGEASISEHRATIDRVFSAGCVEQILALLETGSDRWSQETARTIRAKSPTATKLAFRQIREGAKLSFDDGMRMEYRMVHRVIAGHEFYEGVRATIIDKDQRPNWQPSSLADVSDEDVDAYFAPLGEKELFL